MENKNKTNVLIRPFYKIKSNFLFSNSAKQEKVHQILLKVELNCYFFFNNKQYVAVKEVNELQSLARINTILMN